jgi:hypothetical protein
MLPSVAKLQQQPKTLKRSPIQKRVSANGSTLKGNPITLKLTLNLRVICELRFWKNDALEDLDFLPTRFEHCRTWSVAN